MVDFTGGAWRSLIDGSEVLVGIPDEQDLHFRYDFSEEDGSMPVSDLSGNEHNLDDGTYSGVGNNIGDKQAAEFDRGSDGVSGDIGDLSPPFHDFFVIRIDDLSDGEYLFSDAENNHPSIRQDDPSTNARASGEDISGDWDTDVHIYEVLWGDGNTETEYIIDGESQGTNSDAANNAEVFGLGFAAFSDDRRSKITVGELWRYDRDKSEKSAEIRGELANRWPAIDLS